MQPITPPKSLTEVTADRIRDAIVSGELPLGSKLSEQRLADTLGVSRSPVRDALATLQSEGLVNVSPKRGSFVFTPDLREVDEICEHRAVLECAALRMGIDRNHTMLIEHQQRAISAMQIAIQTEDAKAYTGGDMLFHRAIVESSGNRSIIRAYHHTISPIKALRTHLFTILNARLDSSMSEHMAILQACIAKDADTATEALAEHVNHLTKAFRAASATPSHTDQALSAKG